MVGRGDPNRNHGCEQYNAPSIFLNIFDHNAEFCLSYVVEFSLFLLSHCLSEKQYDIYLRSVKTLLNFYLQFQAFGLWSLGSHPDSIKVNDERWLTVILLKLSTIVIRRA